VETEIVFGHIKSCRSFRRFSLQGLEKVHTEFGIEALAHNFLKVAGIRLTAFQPKQKTKKGWAENRYVFRSTFYFWDLLDKKRFVTFLGTVHELIWKRCMSRAEPSFRPALFLASNDESFDKITGTPSL
jgi:hypothetical protein